MTKIFFRNPPNRSIEISDAECNILKKYRKITTAWKEYIEGLPYITIQSDSDKIDKSLALERDLKQHYLRLADIKPPRANNS